ncbi:unnamed protein product [Diatraea saccharalis]|uniref:Uncharacterized protein n=1 Tax=Diatraea saccharalis TaxID=40085 RepID=A0A9N9QYZ7_9NEOP|nr:unnamed protein product [Diatraea saccharalis]
MGDGNHLPSGDPKQEYEWNNTYLMISRSCAEFDKAAYYHRSCLTYTYAENIFTGALENATKGIIVNGRYADDTILLAQNIDGLQHMVTRIEKISSTYGLTE